ILLAAKPFGRRAEAAADALLRLSLLLALGLGVRVVLAADQLDLRHLGTVAAAVPEPQDAGVAAGTAFEARGQGVEQLADDLTIVDVAEDQPPRVQRAPVGLARRQPALGDRDEPL